MRILHGLAVPCCALFLSIAPVVLAQQGGIPPAAEPLSPALREPQPSVTEAPRPQVEDLDLPVYLKDKDGKLQLVPGFTLEAFDELWNLRNQMPAQAARPAASVAAITVTGDVLGSWADLTVEATIAGAFSDRSSSALKNIAGPQPLPTWVDVPLSLHEARLTEPAKHEGSGQHRLVYDQERRRYVSWLSPTDDSDQRITLKAQAPVETQAQVSRLKLTLPAATQSRLTIRVPRSGIVGELLGGSGGRLEQTTAGGRTDFSIVGARGECELAWRDAAIVAQKAAAVFESAGFISVKIDGRSAQINTRLTVNSLNQGAFDRFQVRLPPGAVYLSRQAGDYSAQAIEGEQEGRRVLEFTRPEMSAEPFTVYLATELARDNAVADAALQLGGFEVPGALQQHGHLVLEGDENWRLLWEHGANVQQISIQQSREAMTVAPADPLYLARPLAAFEYSSQPFSFPLKIAPRTTRVEVEPKYAFTVGAKWVTLDARLKYRIRGTGLFSLEIDLPGWTVDPESFQPSTAINLDDLVETEVAPLRLPLFSPTSGELEVTLRATRAIPEGADSINIEIPRPHADFLHRAEVAIIPEDNVELSPQPDAMVGLSRQLTTSIRLPVRQQSSLVYRAEQPNARFAAGYQVHAGQVTANVRSVVRLDQTRGDVRQQVEYFIAYEPLDQMIVEMPRSLADSGQVKFMLDKQSLTQSRVAETELTPDRPARVRIGLPAERRIGTGAVTIEYPLNFAAIAPATSRMHTIPLVTPVGVELLRNELELTAPADWKVQPGSAAWTESTAPAGQSGREIGLHLNASLPQTEIPLRVTREDESNVSTTIIEREWIQTWLTPSERVERILFRVMTAEESLAITLPTGTDMGRVDVYLDGSPQTAGRGRGTDELVIPLDLPASDDADNTNADSGPADGQATDRQEHLVEIRYAFSRAPKLSGDEPLAAPRFASDVRVGRSYWQLILPRDRHLVSGPEQYVNEFDWTWNGWCFVRRPLMEQSDLERWIGAKSSGPLPAATNRYLFSSMQGLPPQHFQVRARRQIVLLASAVVLVGGLLLTYVPACRRPPALFVAGLAGLAAAALYPDPAALLLQAGSLGVVLALVGVILRRTVPVPRRQPPHERRSGSSIVRRSSSSSRQRPPLVGSAASTEIKAPSPVEVGSQEPQT